MRPDQPNKVLVDYTGDETAAGQFPHGNSSSSTRNYVRIQPHVIHDVRSAAGSGTAQNIYQSMVAHAAADNQHPTSAPRNTEQVRNTLKRERNKGRLTRDNVHEFALDTNFIHHITTFPDLSVIIYAPAVINIFRFAAQLY